MDGTHQITELVPKLTAQGDIDRIPPDKEDGLLPKPVRSPSGPARGLLPPPQADTRLEGGPELSGRTPGETPFEPGVANWGIVRTELGKVDDS